MTFKYSGVIPASKSIMNRALICSSYAEDLVLLGHSSCDDVVKMVSAVQQLSTKINTENLVFDCGAAGTVFRFLSLRLSRIPGTHTLKGSERLMRRPQQDLLDLFARLGVTYEIGREHLILHSNAWKNLNRAIEVNRAVSSQFASGLILNAWNLQEDLVLDMVGEPMSEGYLAMTLYVVQQLGMNIERQNSHLIVKAQSQIIKKEYIVESDLSSLFAVATYAVLNGEAEFQHYPAVSLQPDAVFLELFKKMGISFELKNDLLKVFKTKEFQGVEANLNSCPDLFPVLAMLCAFAQTPSRLYGAPQLIHKESNRIAKVAELLQAVGVQCEERPDGMLITPKPQSPISCPSFDYDTDHDHRLAFAAALLYSQGYPIRIQNPEVVRKSFPEFWQVVGLDLKQF